MIGLLRDGDFLRIDLAEGRIRTGVKAGELEDRDPYELPDPGSRIRGPLRPLGPPRSRRSRALAERQSGFQLSSLYVYPIKSCAGIAVEEWKVDERGLRHDRRWMLVDEAGNFMSQRSSRAWL